MTRTPPPSEVLSRVARGDLCTGCGACAGLIPNKIAMETRAPGWLRPVQQAPLEPFEDRLIAAICPGLGQQVSVAGRKTSVLWGPYVKAQSGHARDPQTRFKGASGGALSAILGFLLTSGKVDAVMQTAAAPDLAIGNTTTISVDIGQILAAAGSRYAPSAPLDEVLSLINEGRRFAFVGKPCDAAALRALIDIKPEYRRSFPVILSFFCAGVPSLAGARGVLDALGVSEAETVGFRYRGHGWPGQAQATLTDGTTREMSYHDSWGGILSKHVQHRCKICADGSGMAADIVCADAWDTDEQGYPKFSEAPGVSLVLGRTRLGQSLIDAATVADHLVCHEFDLGELARIQPGQRERRRAVLARLAALRMVGRPVPRYLGLQLWAAARQNPAGRNIRNFLGTLRRAIRSRRQG